jgi:predicted amidophosphoribosyltransferase
MRRGFNQSTMLARRLGLPVVHALWRTKVTVPQAGLTAAARRRNVAGGFTLSAWMRRPSQQRLWLTGRCVVLVDDVWTTGATLNACADVLKHAGVREVRAVTVARAAPPATKVTKDQFD